MRAKPSLPIAQNAHNRHKGVGDKREGDTRDPYDWYVEPGWCTDLLLNVMPIHGQIWDPACGCGTIVKRCRDRGLDVVGTDLVDRGHGFEVSNFIDGGAPVSCLNISHVITNPPYYRGKGTQAFMERGLEIASHSVAVLAPIPFLASKGRFLWFRNLPISHVFVLSQRPSMPPGVLLESGTVSASGGKEDYIWIVATHGHVGPPMMDWLMPGTSPRS